MKILAKKHIGRALLLSEELDFQEEVLVQIEICHCYKVMQWADILSLN
jgi:hypothetical protein